MATPSFRLLYEQFGHEATFTALGRPHLLELLDGNPWFDDTIPFEVHGSRPEFQQKSIIRRLRQEKFDAMVLFPNSFRSAMIAWLGGARQRIGYGKQGRSFFLTHFAKIPKQEVPLVDYYLSLADTAVEAIGGRNFSAARNDTSDRHRLELHVTPEEEKLGDEIWKTLGLRSPDKVIILNVCSANSLVKYWPIDYAAELSQRITRQLDMDILLNCGPGEIDTVNEVAERSKSSRVFSMANLPMNMHTGKICIKRARLTVSTDSGPLHIALAYGNPAIVLLGPTSETYIANPTVDQTVISRYLPCSPCHAKRKCPEKHHHCMLEITPDIVFEKVVDILNRRSKEQVFD